jgi:hypothetical protein
MKDAACAARQDASSSHAPAPSVPAAPTTLVVSRHRVEALPVVTPSRLKVPTTKPSGIPAVNAIVGLLASSPMGPLPLSTTEAGHSSDVVLTVADVIVNS